MSSASVRQQLVDYFTNAQIPGLNTVFKAPPWYVDGQSWNLEDGLGTGSVGYIHLSRESETRISLPAITGTKQVDYEIGFLVLYQYLQPSATFTAPSVDDWTTDLDTTIDAIKALIRKDPTLGGEGAIFQGGQDRDDLRLTRDLPRLASGKILAWNLIEFAVTEMITA